MALLTSFGIAPHIAIIGASGGIGKALTEVISAARPACTLSTFARKIVVSDLHNVRAYAMDIVDPLSIETAVAKAAAAVPFDLVIVATGLLHRFPHVVPEKSMQDLNQNAMHEIFAVNAIGPALVAKHFLPMLKNDGRSAFAVLSARVGSIADNRLGGWTSYRASKAALNMIVKTLAIEQARRNPESVLAALHPGTVDTSLSQPYASRVPQAQLFSPARAARELLAVLDTLTPKNSGGFFAWDGTPIAY